MYVFKVVSCRIVACGNGLIFLGDHVTHVVIRDLPNLYVRGADNDGTESNIVILGELEAEWGFLSTPVKEFLAISFAKVDKTFSVVIRFSE